MEIDRKFLWNLEEPTVWDQSKTSTSRAFLDLNRLQIHLRFRLGNPIELFISHVKLMKFQFYTWSLQINGKLNLQTRTYIRDVEQWYYWLGAIKVILKICNCMLSSSSSSRSHENEIPKLVFLPEHFQFLWPLRLVVLNKSN